MKSRKTAATGGLLKMSIGGEAGLSEKYDRRKDYQAYQEGDIVEDESLIIKELNNGSKEDKDSNKIH